MNTAHIPALIKATELVGGKAALARKLGVKPATVQQWSKGDRPIPPRLCTGIEKLVEGAVTRRELRPDDWQEIWPELADQQD